MWWYADLWRSLHEQCPRDFSTIVHNLRTRIDMGFLGWSTRCYDRMRGDGHVCKLALHLPSLDIDRCILTVSIVFAFGLCSWWFCQMVLKVEPLKVENERIFGSFGVHSFFSFSFFCFLVSSLDWGLVAWRIWLINCLTYNLVFCLSFWLLFLLFWILWNVPWAFQHSTLKI